MAQKKVKAALCTDSSKVCKHCGIWKSLDEFHISPGGLMGRRSRCKQCTSTHRAGRYNREEHLEKKYGLTLHEYDQLLFRQGGCCAICGTTNPGGHAGRFHVDHNHETGEIRGLLCGSCNTGIGLLKDSPTILQQALFYLSTNGHYGKS